VQAADISHIGSWLPIDVVPQLVKQASREIADADTDAVLRSLNATVLELQSFLSESQGKALAKLASTSASVAMSSMPAAAADRTHGHQPFSTIVPLEEPTTASKTSISTKLPEVTTEMFSANAVFVAPRLYVASGQSGFVIHRTATRIGT
jgi:hypothetical protein